jgi:hypothetical protein
LPPALSPLPDNLCPRGAVGERFESADTHPQNARTLVHDWRAKSGNSENYCPRCHKNTRPLPPRVHWYRLECFPPAGLVFQPGNLNAAQATIRGNGENLRPPSTSMVAVLHTSFVHPPAPHTAFLSKAGSDPPVTRNELPTVVTSCASGIRRGGFRSLRHWPVGSLGRGAFPGKIVTHPRCGWGGNSENVGPPRRSHRQRKSRNHFSACQSSSGGIGPSRQRVGAARNPSVGSQQFRGFCPP